MLKSGKAWHPNPFHRRWQWFYSDWWVCVYLDNIAPLPAFLLFKEDTWLEWYRNSGMQTRHFTLSDIFSVAGLGFRELYFWVSWYDHHKLVDSRLNEDSKLKFDDDSNEKCRSLKLRRILANLKSSIQNFQLQNFWLHNFRSKFFDPNFQPKIFKKVQSSNELGIKSCESCKFHLAKLGIYVLQCKASASFRWKHVHIKFKQSLYKLDNTWHR